jgi:GNAT superfamily N-acetyltransferase
MASIFDTLKINLSIGRPLPQGLLQLRRDIFQKEVHYLNEYTLESAYDDCGVHVLINTSCGKTIGAAHVLPADQGEMAFVQGISVATLKTGFTITRVMVDPAYRSHGLMRVLIYLSLQQARLWNRSRLFCFIEPNENAARKATRCEVLPIRPHIVTGSDGKRHEFLIGTQDIARTAAYVYDGLLPDACRFLEESIANEIVHTVESKLDQFFCNPWFVAIRSQSLSRHQYIESLGNMHQFVRMTTRVIARAVSLTNDGILRNHFAQHLQGEIDHEKMLENDLRCLGADVDYVRDRMIPNKETRQFMVIQESLLGYRHDPVQYLAVPFCIEGFSANLNQHFLQDLAQCIIKFGGTPKAMSFIRSHVITDGGVDGHWAKNLEVVRHSIRNDLQAQEFISLIHLTFEALEASYGSFVAKADPFQTNTNEITQATNHVYERALPLNSASL